MFRNIRNPMATATLAVILTLGFGLSVTAGAAASDRYEQHSPNPTIVFVHGGWADSSSWNQEITNLERLGYPVIAPANPLRDLASDSAYVRSVLQTISGPIVLVAHSYGGAVITQPAVRGPNGQGAVFIAQVAP